jgi:hypothetical protein
MDTAVPACNFTVSTEERVGAIAKGPPAFARRRRAIEDLEEAIVRALVQLCCDAASRGADVAEQAAHARRAAPGRAIGRLGDLVARHNRWYPIEANLPMDPRTGQLLERSGEPWRPLGPVTLDDLLARAVRRACGESDP